MDYQPGDLVFLSEAYEKYVFEKNPKLRISLVNRLAKIEDIIDWSTPKGQKIKEAREKSGKWKDLIIEDNKYILSVYYHDLTGRKGQMGVVERGVPMFEKHPRTLAPFFFKVPDWVYREIKAKCDQFDVRPENGFEVPL
jgi:hypothetical protein